MPQELAFVTTDGFARIGSPERLLIRSHCMRGKNKQSGSRRVRREAVRAESGKPVNPKKQEPDSVAKRSPSRIGTAAARRRPNLMPLPPPSDWALFSFPTELDSSSQELMHKYFLCNPIRDPLNPFSHFYISVDFGQEPMICFRMLCDEPLSFHATLLLASASDDMISHKPLSSTSYYHLKHTLPVLNMLLSDAKAQKDDVIIYAVSILASVAVLFGDYDAAASHAAGLSQLIRLRGGFRALDANPLVQVSLDRLNFSNSQITDQWPAIYDISVWEEPVFPPEVAALGYSQRVLSIHELVNPELEGLFHTLQSLALILNQHYYDKVPIKGEFLQQCQGYAHRRILELNSPLEDGLSECFRLGMAAFLTTTFRLPDSDIQHGRRSLASDLQNAYAATKATTSYIPKSIDIWLMIMCVVAAGNTVHPDVGTSWAALATHGLSWNVARRHAKKIMWVDSFQDGLGKKAFGALMRKCKVGA
ncbi:hypothetical protein GQ53DRAFT_750700 [Thozetella sp. PMI_491]|nr:hypothetical protein GQ53DRAFT_750700 [Thozetella sp. PMI_491]